MNSLTSRCATHPVLVVVPIYETPFGRKTTRTSCSPWSATNIELTLEDNEEEEEEETEEKEVVRTGC